MGMHCKNAEILSPKDKDCRLSVSGTKRTKKWKITFLFRCPDFDKRMQQMETKTDHLAI